MNIHTQFTFIPRDEQTSSPVKPFYQRLADEGFADLRRAPLKTLQINLGRLCNQACEHCHVDAGPKRKEIMSQDTMTGIVKWVKDNHVRDIDITGGAPEMVPGFRKFVDQLIDLGAQITVRCNLTILFETGQDDLADWYADRAVHLVCSLPCYSESNVDSQRGKGVYKKSIAALQKLNQVGYAQKDNLILDLVYNPGGAFLPPPQETLEADYKKILFEEHGITFNSLLALTNLPINRFTRYLKNNNQYDTYMELLNNAFNPATVESLMCRHLISVDWQGFVYDCDFNQMLGMDIGGRNKRVSLFDTSVESLSQNRIGLGNHCYGCTAGAGSSCGGSLA